MLGSGPAPAWLPSLETVATGFAGIVTDLLTGQPVAGARVTVQPLTRAAVTDAAGYYSLSTPPSTYEVHVSARGYLGMYRLSQQVADRQVSLVDFQLLPESLTEDQQRVIYDQVVKVHQRPLEEEEPLHWEPLSIASEPTVPETIPVRFEDGHVEEMGLDYYLKGVVPAEVPASWPAETLKAQAIAARSYAVAYTRGGTPICVTTACQVYDPSRRFYTTDAAVDDTHGVVAVYDNTVIGAFYFSRCNSVTTRDSEHALDWRTCQESPWDYVAYARARPCGGHAPYTNSCGYYGHGVGMCQWGAYARGQAGKDYRTILYGYYTAITITGTPGPTPLSPVNGALLWAGLPITLWWNSAGDDHRAEIWNEEIRRESGWLGSATSWSPGTLPAGHYQWRAGVRNPSGGTTWGETWQLVTVSKFYRIILPQIRR